MTNGFQLTDGVLTFSPDKKVLRAQEFIGRDDIVRVIIPSSVTRMEEEVFSECENLEEAIFSPGLERIGVGAFTTCAKLRSVKLPSTLRVIEEGAFMLCLSLSRLELPQGIEELRDMCFENSALEEIVIPESCRYIGEEAFFGCEGLHRADVLAPDAFIGKNAFGSCYELIRGYIAPGFPSEDSPGTRLLYSMLYLTCPEKHTQATKAEADGYIRANIPLIMERVLKYGNVPALTGLVTLGFLKGADISAYLSTALENGLTEISALLLKAKGRERNIEEEFEL